MNSTTLQEHTGHERNVLQGSGPSGTVESRVIATSIPVRRRWFMPGVISFVFCAANAAISAAFIAPYLKDEQKFTDLVGGTLAWSGADKGFDFRLFYAFLAIFSLLFLLVTSLFRRLATDEGIKKALERALALSLTPVALWLGGRLTTNSFGNPPIENTLVAAYVLVVMAALSRRQFAVTAKNIIGITNASLLGLLFAFFAALGAVTTLSRLVYVPTEGVTFKLVAFTCGLNFLIILVTVFVSANADEIERRAHRLVFVWQAALPLLCTVIVPPAVVEGGRQIMFRPSIPLLLALFAIMVTAWAAFGRCWIRSRPVEDVTLRQSLVPLTILPIALFLATHHNIYPTFFGDEFHTGEHLLPWQQLHDFGKLPFVGFVPIHPLMDFFVSGVNALFFDGTLANYENSRAILFAVAAGLTFLTVVQFGGVGLALSIAFAANLWDRLLLIPVLFAVFCSATVVANSRRWLVCWFSLCPLAVFYNPAAGVALTLASIPIALFQMWQLYRQDRVALLRVIVAVATASAVIVVIPQTRAITFGFANFMIENGRSVLLIHGIEWQARAAQMPAAKGILAAPLVWETLRFTWIIVLLIAAWVFLSRARERANVQPQILATGLMSCLFLFFLAGWTLTRLDPFSPSRPGEVSYLACLYLLPLLFFMTGSRRQVLIPMFAFAIGLFQGATADFINSGSKPHSRMSPITLLETPTNTLSVPAGCASVDGKSIGLPNLGRIYAPPEAISRVSELKANLDAWLRPGETYLDLTSRQANYFYLGLPSPVSYGAPWLASNTVLQNRLLSEIKLKPPPVVWIGPTLSRGPDTPALRLYKLYRFLLRNYVPFSKHGYIFLVSSDRLQQRDLETQDKLEILREAFGDFDLGSLPSAWGLSWSRLAHYFADVQTLNTTDAPITRTGGVWFQSNTDRVNGQESDFVKLDFWSNLRPPAKVLVEISWKSEHGSGSARLFAANGTNLVPLGAFPDWLLAQNISDIKLAPVAPPAGLTYTIRNVELMRLKD